MTHGNEKYPIPDDFINEFNSIPNCTIKHFETKYGVSTLTVKRWAKIAGVVFTKSNSTLEERYGLDNVKQWLEQCETPNDINALIKKYGWRMTTVVSFCKRHNIPYAHLMGKSVIEAPPKEQLEQLLAEGKTNQQIEKIYGITNPVLKRWFKQHQIERKPYDGTIKEIPSDFKQWYDEQSPSLVEIGKKYNVARPTIVKWLKQLEIKHRGVTNKKEIPPVEELIKLNDEKVGSAAIAERYNVSMSVVVKWFRHYNIALKSPNDSGKSKAENDILDFLNSNGFNFKSCKGALPNGYYELDGYDPSIQMAFEYNGLYWHSYDVNPENKRKHLLKTQSAKQVGIRLYHIFENEWINKPDIVKSMLLVRAGAVKNKFYGRNCTVAPISSKRAFDFHEENHIDGGATASKSYGVFAGDQLVLVLSMVRSRFDKKYQWEISRLSTKLNTVVIGGVNKAFNMFVNEENPSSVISYSNLRWGEGKVYGQLGFELIGSTPPNYFYFKQGSYHLESRMKFQKKQLANILTTYDENLSEKENMRNNNYLHIYDCGNNKWVWKGKGA